MFGIKLAQLNIMSCLNIIFVFLVGLSAQAEVNNKNPFEPLLLNQQVSTAGEFVTIVLQEQDELLKKIPEYNSKLKGIQNNRLIVEFRRAQFFYHQAVLKFLNKNIKNFIKLNPTPDQVNQVLRRAVVTPPINYFSERPTFFSEAFHIQKALLEHYLPLAGKWEAARALLDYTPQDIYLLQNKTNIVENHMGHLTRIGLVDRLHEMQDYNKDKPFFFETITYLKHYFHYPHLNAEQKAKKLISILLNTAEDVPLDFLKHKKSLIDKGQRITYDLLDESNSLQYANATMQATFLQMQLLRVLRNFLNSHFLILNLNEYDLQRLHILAKEFDYNLEFYKNRLVGLSFKQNFFQRLFNKNQPAIGRAKMCFLMFQ
ncbi:MAG: hypothetical protein MK008_01705 [Bdellovibrionales bacterium]|nr:hypothetical protein [Bdellovibrionales bacterium]